MNKNRQHIRTIYEGDVSDFTALASIVRDDVVLHVPGEHPLAGDHVGLPAVATFLEESRSITTAGEHIDLVDLMEGERFVAAYVEVTADRAGRAPLRNHTVHLFRLDADDQVSEIWFHNREQSLVDTFWG